MDINKNDTAVVFIDPQNEVLSEKGLAWGSVGDSVKENKTVENMERIFKAAKQNGFEVFISPHYFFPTAHFLPKWKIVIATFIVANTINSLSRYILNRFLTHWSLLASTTVYTIILVVLLTYLGMPTVSRLLRQWLYPRTTNL